MSDGTADKKKGSLTIVGTGIQAIGHLTFEAKANIQHADAVFYLVAEPIAERYLLDINPAAKSLFHLYARGKERMTSYREMVSTILRPVRMGLHVCAAFYGHPGVFVFPSHEAIRQAREEGHSAEMLPGISAEDCLFSDLGVEPGIPGCQSFEATDFLICKRRHDPRSSLILWQIGVIGLLSWWEEDFDYRAGLSVLTDILLQSYPREHMVVVYEASHLPGGEARRDAISLKDLPGTEVTPISTLYIPPFETAVLDEIMLSRLGINKEAIPRIERKLRLE